MAAVGEVSPLDFPRLAAAQLECRDIKVTLTSASLSATSRVVGGQKLLGDVSTGRFRPFLPVECRRDACAALHGLHHPGIRGTKKLLCASLCWPGMSKEVGVVCKELFGVPTWKGA